jgi:hypothetical protein
MVKDSNQVASLGCTIIECLDVDAHHYRALAPTSHINSSWLQAVAAKYIALRTECKGPLAPVVVDGITVFDVQQVRSAIRRGAIPKRRSGSNFDVVRSDFGETLAYILLEMFYGSSLGYQSVRDRELTNSTGRGIDVLAIEWKEKLTLVIGEVKVSNDKASPPQVVDTSDDCLRNQHLGHLSDRATTAKKITNSSRNITDAKLRSLFIFAAELLEEGQWNELDIITYSLLVRPRNRYISTDFGSFYTTPSDYVPSNIRFVVFCIPDEVEPIIQEWYAIVEKLNGSDSV